MRLKMVKANLAFNIFFTLITLDLFPLLQLLFLNMIYWAVFICGGQDQFKKVQHGIFILKEKDAFVNLDWCELYLTVEVVFLFRQSYESVSVGAQSQVQPPISTLAVLSTLRMRARLPLQTGLHAVTGCQPAASLPHSKTKGHSCFLSLFLLLHLVLSLILQG